MKRFFFIGFIAGLAIMYGLSMSAIGPNLIQPGNRQSPHLAPVKSLSEAQKTQIVRDVEAVLRRQQTAWNAADIPEFMTGYWQSPNMRFASGARINRGWQATFDRYLIRYPDHDAMGRLDFYDLETQILSADHALVFGRWQLTKTGKQFGGLFTLHFENIEGAWKIVSDHTSSG